MHIKGIYSPPYKFVRHFCRAKIRFCKYRHAVILDQGRQKGLYILPAVEGNGLYVVPGYLKLRCCDLKSSYIGVNDDCIFTKGIDQSLSDSKKKRVSVCEDNHFPVGLHLLVYSIDHML